MSGEAKTNKRKSRWSDRPPSDDQPSASSSSTSSSHTSISSQKIHKREASSSPESERRTGFGFASSSSSSSTSSKSPATNATSSFSMLASPFVASPSSSSSSSSVATKTSFARSDDFTRQMQEAAERAKRLASQMKAPKSYVDPKEQFKKIASIAAADPTAGMSDEQKKQYVEQKELNKLYEIMMAKRAEMQNLAKKIQLKHAYDSDEEVDDDGTWEHKMRKAELEATKEWATKLTEMATGKHHIGDFLPPAELDKFMETFKALKEGRNPDHSDYKEFKLNAENIGFKMLKKLGWSEGQGLGPSASGIIDPVNKGQTTFENAGLGVKSADKLAKDDSEFEMYRKRMMLAYKFRPNPMNNPRRPYY